MNKRQRVDSSKGDNSVYWSRFNDSDFVEVVIGNETDMVPLVNSRGERGGLVVKASDSGSRGRGFEPHSGQTVLCP